jgi:hypothetical protein
MATKFKSKLVFGKTGVFDSIGIGVQDPDGKLHISGRDFRLTNGSAYFDSRPLVNGSPVMLSGDTVSIDVSDLYPVDNPSGYITGISNLVYTTGSQNISGAKNFYQRPTLNGTGFLLSGEEISVIGDYYPNNNPSGFITTGNFANYVSNNTSNISGSTIVNNMMQITQAGYNAISSPLTGTLYIIVG